MSRLPSLTGLRAFEAAGRHLSFTRAATELHVSQAAVSHAIKSLEEQLGVRLFRRGPRGLLLTEQGQSFLPPVRDAFRRLEAATETLIAQDASGALTVSVLPSFAARWLVPRLSRFRDRHPEIDVLVSAHDAPINFDRDNVDVALRYGAGDYTGVVVEPFLTEEIFPVVSPVLRARPPGLRRPEDLAHYTLLHDDLEPGWPAWLLRAGLTHIDPRRGPAFSDSSMLLQAAVDGQGVALGRSALARDDLKAGRLVRPFHLSLPAQFSYFVLYPPHTARRAKVIAFRDWLMDEAAADDGTGLDPPGGRPTGAEAP